MGYFLESVMCSRKTLPKCRRCLTVAVRPKEVQERTFAFDIWTLILIGEFIYIVVDSVAAALLHKYENPASLGFKCRLKIRNSS